MKLQVTVDTLINAAVIAGIIVLVLTAFYNLYDVAQKGIRLMHLEYLSQVIEDRMRVCHIVDGVRVYAPYEVNVICEEGKICWNDLCREVSCTGGGKGKTFVIRGCSLLPEG